MQANTPSNTVVVGVVEGEVVALLVTVVVWLEVADVVLLDVTVVDRLLVTVVVGVVLWLEVTLEVGVDV